MRKRMKKWVVGHTMGRRKGRRRKRSRRRETESKPKRTHHPYGNMSQSREEPKRVGPPDLFARIVKRLTQVHIPV